MASIKFVDQGEAKRPKKQKLVKHRRKNWAKTDISDVERQIDDLNRQKLAGGLLAEKKDEELFVISKKPTLVETTSKKQKRTLEEKLNGLGCYQNLRPDPISANAHVVAHRKEPDLGSNRQAKLRDAELKRMKRKQKESQLNQHASSKKQKKLDVLLESNPTDIWNAKASKNSKKNDASENDYLKPAMKIPVKKPKNPLQKVESQNPKLEIPHPGMSYNPEYEDHQKLLLKAHEIELKKLKQEQKELKKMKSNVPNMSWKEIEELWLKEMSLNQDIESVLAEIENEADEKNVTSPAPSKKKEKTKLSRLKSKKKQLLQKIKERQKENEKKARAQQSEVYRIKSLLKEIKAKEKEVEEKVLQKQIQEKHRELFEPKRLGKVKYEEPEIDLKLSDEITGSLRTLKPEGNILRDSYKQLQKRNILEPREKANWALIPRTKRKFWKKTFDKRSALEKTYFIK